MLALGALGALAVAALVAAAELVSPAGAVVAPAGGARRPSPPALHALASSHAANRTSRVATRRGIGHATIG
jgi:hypothetical protein